MSSDDADPRGEHTDLADRDIAKINALTRDAIAKAAELDGLLHQLAGLLEERR
jgi:hypothetical protein